MQSFTKGEKGFPFFLWTLRVFYFGILKFWSLQFASYHFGVFNFFVWSFTSEEKGHLPFFLWTGFFVMLFWNFGVFNLILVILLAFIFFVQSFIRGERGYLPFFLWTLKVLCFGILKFWSFEVDGMNKYPVVLGY